MQWDAIVVGAGAAGLYTALCLPEHWHILLITKEELTLSASGWAQGGIAAAIAPNDSTASHVADTLRAGAGLCEPDAVHFLVENASECIESLVELGVAFDRAGQELAMTREAAHSFPRVLHAADRTGKAVVTTLAEKVLQRENICVCAGVFVLRLWFEAGRCKGLAVIQENHLKWLMSPRVILATGGGGQVFSNSTNPALSTGDGVALAYAEGAQLRDLEFFQFHPTALMKPGAPRFLISEAVRGEGAHLLDDQGARFMPEYHPDAELAPRDVVSRSIFQHLQKSGSEQVWLDLSPIPEAQIRYRFPNIIQVCQKWGVDLFRGPIPVAPAAHYWMGGIVTNFWGQTTLPGLYAVGETASTGVHGANRLASNSLLECIVFGRKLAQQAMSSERQVSSEPSHSAKKASGPKNLWVDEPRGSQQRVNEKNLGEQDIAQVPSGELRWNDSEVKQLAMLRQSVAEILWRGAGICRDAVGLEKALGDIQSLRAQFFSLRVTQSIGQVLSVPPGIDSDLETKTDEQGVSQMHSLRAWGELSNLFTVGELILKSALFRQESRGGHFRLDFPESSESWRSHTLVEGERLFQSELVQTRESDQENL